MKHIMRRSNAPTLQDVAKEVGVSITTASIVLHGARSTTRVSEATRSRILEVAHRLRYRPNAIARCLHRRRMDALGVITVIDGGELNLYFLEVLNGILEGAAHHGQNTTIFSISDWRTDEARILKFCDNRVDGIVLLAPHFVTSTFAETLHHHMPLVMIHGNGDLPNAYNMDVDNEGGAYEMVSHLIRLGHRRIAHFAGYQELRDARQRQAGYCRALAEAGIPREEALIFPGHYSHSSGKRQTQKLLESHPGAQLPTAIFCASDAIASASLEVLATQGIRAPEQISIAGFDDTLIARTTQPPLTTVRQPLRVMGRRAVDRLLQQIQDETSPEIQPETFAVVQTDRISTDTSVLSETLKRSSSEAEAMPLQQPQTEIFNVELVIRESVGPPGIR